MPSKTKVIAGKPKIGGAIFRAPYGTPLPTDAMTPLDKAFKELGYASSDGWSRKITKAFNTINAWGGDEINKSRTELSLGIDTTLVEELNGDTQEAKWGTASVTQTDATADHGNLITVAYDGSDDLDPYVWVFDMAEGRRLHRSVFMNAVDTTESFEQTFSDSDIISLPFSLSVYRDDATGLFFYDYLDDGKVLKA